MDTNAQSPPSPAPHHPSPGSRLRAARERRGLSLNEAADALHLDPWLLEALERDDFAALGAPVFAKGHLRKYAALTGEPIDDILLAYHQCEGVHELPPLLDRAGILRAATPPSRGVPAAAIFGLLLACGAAGVWWWYEQPLERPIPLGVASNTGGALAAAALDAQSETEDGETSNTSALTLDAQLVEDANARDASPRMAYGATATAPAGASSGAGSTTAASTPRTGSTTGTTGAPGTTGATDASVAPPPAQPVESIGSMSPASARAGEHVLMLAFDGDSWVEVRDAGGARLYYGLGVGGSRRNLRGAPPFEIFLGRYADVHVALDGEQRDVPSDAVRGNTARFTLEAR